MRSKHHSTQKMSEKTTASTETAAETSVPIEEPTPPANTATAEQPVATATESDEVAVFKERYTRLLADFDNFRKRQIREREELIKRANSDLLSDLLPVVDHLELALNQLTKSNDPFVTGVKLVYDQLLTLLDHYDMKAIDTQGEPFDPSYHEALSQMPSTTVPPHTIIDQFRKGWLLAGKLLRPAQVIVSSGPPEEPEQPTENLAPSDG